MTALKYPFSIGSYAAMRSFTPASPWVKDVLHVLVGDLFRPPLRVSLAHDFPRRRGLVHASYIGAMASALKRGAARLRPDAASARRAAPMRRLLVPEPMRGPSVPVADEDEPNPYRKR